MAAMTFTCPACTRRSSHPRDISDRYCSLCHWWTGDQALASARPDLFSRYGRPTPPHPWLVDEVRSSGMSIMDWSKPIRLDNMPPGAQVYELPFDGRTLLVIGRRVATDQPCTAVGGCGGVATASLYRCPTSGLNLPGEPSPVSVVRWCVAGCRPEMEPVPADEQEREWGWDHDNVV
jgi:hypothetical protein